jgi:hypothetical protein
VAFIRLVLEKKHGDSGVSRMSRSTINPESLPTKLPEDPFFLVKGHEWLISNTGGKSMDCELSRYP